MGLGSGLTLTLTPTLTPTLTLTRCVYVGNLPPTEILDNEALKSLVQRAMVRVRARARVRVRDRVRVSKSLAQRAMVERG